MNKVIKSKKKSKIKSKLIIKNISKAQLTKEDIIVIHSECGLSSKMIEDIKLWLKEIFPNNKAMCINKGFKLSIVTDKGEN